MLAQGKGAVRPKDAAIHLLRPLHHWAGEGGDVGHSCLLHDDGGEDCVWVHHHRAPSCEALDEGDTGSSRRLHTHQLSGLAAGGGGGEGGWGDGVLDMSGMAARSGCSLQRGTHMLGEMAEDQ